MIKLKPHEELLLEAQVHWPRSEPCLVDEICHRAEKSEEFELRFERFMIKVAGERL